jgi:hypothetical protein
MSKCRTARVSESVFFIVGSGRSGTTLLRALLDARPDVRIPGETHFYTTYRIENALKFHFATPNNYHKAAQAYSKWRHVNYEKIDWARMAEIAQELPPRRGSLLRAYLIACCEAKGACVAGEKTPGHIRALQRIWKDFPTARVVHIMRDPRAVAASYLSHDLYKRVFGSDVTRAALKWREAARIHLRVSRSGYADKYLPVRYEDLVADPNTELERICKFLNIEPRADNLELYMRHKLTLPKFDNHANVGRDIFRGESKWRNTLSEDDVALIEQICGRHIEALEYPYFSKKEMKSTRVLARRAAFHCAFAGYCTRRMISALGGSARQ